MTIAEDLAHTPVTALDLDRYVSVPIDLTVAETIDGMTKAGVSSAFVVDGGALKGIFTQRDVLTRVLGTSGTCHKPVADVMTVDPKTIGAEQSVGEGLHIMNELWVRSVPVLGRDQEIVGNLSYYPLMKHMAALLRERSLRTPHEVSVRDGMMFVDFTGLNYSQPVTVRPDASVAVAVHQMAGRSPGFVQVADEREHLIGVITEFDLQTRVGCVTDDLARITADEVMTSDPIALSIRTPVGQALEEMAEHGFSHIPLLGESGRLVGVSSFRDVADYFEKSLSVLG